MSLIDVSNHYQSLLAGHYSWMSGGLELNIKLNREFFQKHDLVASNNRLAVDLGAGCGFQSIPLAQAGFVVTAIDISEELLQELRINAEGL
jgi:2-polyprenyl-3-methyl-5-hydroxy-6-metoxy-1,4-benzoquinol methylase